MDLSAGETLSAEELIGALNALGVPFLAGGEGAAPLGGLPPARLLAALAEQTDARLRPAIVPLLLCRPELARVIPEALSLLSGPGLTNLKLFYTAAMLLQQEYGPSLCDLLEACVAAALQAARFDIIPGELKQHLEAIRRLME